MIEHVYYMQYSVPLHAYSKWFIMQYGYILHCKMEDIHLMYMLYLIGQVYYFIPLHAWSK